MKRLLTTFLLWLLCLAVYLPFGVLHTAPLVIDFNEFKAPLSELVQESLGQSLDIRGELRLVTLPLPGVTAQDVHLMADGEDTWSMERLTAHIRILPLLSGELRVRDVKLAGSTYLITPFTRALPGQEEETPDALADTPPDLSFFQGTDLFIERADIIYDDGSSFLSWTGTNLSIRDIQPQGWTLSGLADCATIFTLDSDEEPFPLFLYGALSIDVDRVVVTLDAAPVAAVLPPGLPFDQELDIAASGLFTYTNEGRQLDLSQVLFTGHDLELTADLTARDLGSDTTAQGSISLAESSPRPFLQVMGMDFADSLSPSGLASVRLQADCSLRHGVLNIDITEGAVDQTALAGRIGLAMEADTPVRLLLHADDIDLYHYLPSEEMEQGQAASQPADPAAELQALSDALSGLPVAGTLAIDTLHIGTLSLSQVELRLDPPDQAEEP